MRLVGQNYTDREVWRLRVLVLRLFFALRAVTAFVIVKDFVAGDLAIDQLANIVQKGDDETSFVLVDVAEVLFLFEAALC